MTAGRKGPGWVTIWTRAIGLSPELGKQHAAVRVALLALARFYSADKPEFYLPEPMAARLAGIPIRTVRRAFLILIAAGWLVRTRKPTPNTPAYYTLAIPPSALDLIDPVTGRTVAQQIATSGQGDRSASGQGDRSREDKVSLTRGQGVRQVLNTPEVPRSADGQPPLGGADPRVGKNYGECVTCGHPVPLGAALCAKCEPAANGNKHKAKAAAATPRLIDEKNGYPKVTAMLAELTAAKGLPE